MSKWVIKATKKTATDQSCDQWNQEFPEGITYSDEKIAKDKAKEMTVKSEKGLNFTARKS